MDALLSVFDLLLSTVTSALRHWWAATGVRGWSVRVVNWKRNDPMPDVPFPADLQPLLDTAEASLAASNEAEAVLSHSNSALAAAEAQVTSDAAVASSAHLQSVSDTQALVDGIKKHFGLN